MPSKVRYEITYPFPNFNGATVGSLEMGTKFHPTPFEGCNYISMLGLKLIHANKMGPIGYL